MGSKSRWQLFKVDFDKVVIVIFVFALLYWLYANLSPKEIDYRLALADLLEQGEVTKEQLDELITEVLPTLDSEDLEVIENTLTLSKADFYATMENAYKAYYYTQLHYLKTTEPTFKTDLFLSTQVVLGHVDRFTAYTYEEQDLHVLEQTMTIWNSNFEELQDTPLLGYVKELYSQEAIDHVLEEINATPALRALFKEG